MLTHPFNHAKQGASLLPPDDRAIYNELEKELKSRRAGRAQFLAEGKQLGRLLNPEVTYGVWIHPSCSTAQIELIRSDSR